MNKKLICHLYFGDPTPEFSLQLARTLLDSGADALEIGIPYSDPVCDGPVFQNACKRALTAGISPISVIRAIRQIRQMGYIQPIYITTYYAPIYALGEKKFVTMVKECGAQGLIVPDLLLEEQTSLQALCTKNNLALIQFATPYTTEERLKTIIKNAKDFLYCISLPTTTGDTRIRLIRQIRYIRRIRRMLNFPDGGQRDTLPLYMGFGISTPSQVQELIAAGANGVIIGSAIARMYATDLDNPEKTLPQISVFIKTIKKAIPMHTEVRSV